MPITAVQKVSVPVRDQSRSQAFYVDALGFKLLADRPMGDGGRRWIEVGTDAGASLILVTWFPEGQGTVRGLVVTTTDIDETCARLRKAGIGVVGPTNEGWGRQATCADPDGNGLVLLQP